MRPVGILLHRPSSVALSLGARTIIGRGPDCAVRIADKQVSTAHALLRYVGSAGWEVRDLGSRNGTWLGDRRLLAGEQLNVPAGAALRFGSLAQEWVLVDAGAPGPAALRLDDEAVRVASGGLLLLPDAEEPEVAISHEPEGWLLEADTGARPAVDGESIVAGGKSWRVHLPPRGDDAFASATLRPGERIAEPIHLRIAVSQDEEHVDVFLSTGGPETQLRSRVHHLLLLLLARERLADAERGLPLPEQGWMYNDVACSHLDIGSPALNLHILRLRQQLAEAGVEGAEQIIERRRLSGQLRLSAATVRIG